MSLREALEDQLREPGRGQAEQEGISIEVDLVDCDRLGAVVEGIRVRGAAADVVERAEAISREVRPGGDHLLPVEVDRGLGGAILRSAPEDVHRGFYELRVSPEGVELSGHKLTSEGQRIRVPYTWTRDQLGSVIDQLERAFRTPENESP